MSSYVSQISVDDREWAEMQRKICDADIYVAIRQEETQRLRSEIQRRQEELKRLREQEDRTISSAVDMLEGNFNKALGGIYTTYKDAVKVQTKTFNDAVASLKDDIRATALETANASVRISKISQGYAGVVAALIKQENNSAKSAGIYLDNILSLIDEIQALNPEVFEPRVYSEVKNIAAGAKANIEAGRYQSALVTAQFGILKASGLLTRLIIANETFKNGIIKATEIAEGLKAKFDRLDTKMDGSIQFELDGEKYEYKYDIEHWSEGYFGELRTKFEEAYRQLLDAHNRPIPIQQLELLKNILLETDTRLDQCDRAARSEMLGSLKVQDTAAKLCESLGDCWELGEHGFDAGDNRNPYTMMYEDGAGNSISIVVASGVSEDKQSIFMEAFGRDDSHSEIVKRNVLANLPNEGICVEQTQHVDDCKSNTDCKTFIQNVIPETKALKSQRRLRNFGM